VRPLLCIALSALLLVESTIPAWAAPLVHRGAAASSSTESFVAPGGPTGLGFSPQAPQAQFVDDCRGLACLLCLLFPEQILWCILCGILPDGPVDDVTSAHLAASSWLTNYDAAIAAGAAPEVAAAASIAPSAPGHSWRASFDPLSSELRVTNTGASLDTALVMAYADSANVSFTIPLSADQAVVAIPAGGTAVIPIPAAKGHRPLFGVFSATGLGLNGDGATSVDQVSVGCVLTCLFCLLDPLNFICCALCAACALEGGLDRSGAVADRASHSAWFSNIESDYLRGRPTAESSADRLSLSAPGHSWSLDFDPGGPAIIITNSGSVDDTALVVVRSSSPGVAHDVALTDLQAVVPVPAGSSARDTIPGLAGESPLILVFSATGAAQNRDGMAFLDLTQGLSVPTESTTHDWFGPPRPSPATRDVEFWLDLPFAQRLDVAVYDLLGRVVQQLSDGVRPAGVQRIRWDGRDSHGSLVPTGIYLVRARSRDRVTTRAVTILH